MLYHSYLEDKSRTLRVTRYLGDVIILYMSGSHGNMSSVRGSQPEIILMICYYRTPTSRSSLLSIDNFNEPSEGM